MVQCKFCKKQLLYFKDAYVCKNCGSIFGDISAINPTFHTRDDGLKVLDRKLGWIKNFYKVVK
jgi:hypothetical protein